MTKIRTSQIDAGDLSVAIQNGSSGSWSGNMSTFIQSSGYFGNYVVYTNQDQFISKTTTFVNPIGVPYSGLPTTAIQRQAVLDLITGSLLQQSGQLTGSTVLIASNQLIGGYKTFTGNVVVGNPINTGDAVNLFYALVISGTLQNAINAVSGGAANSTTVVHTTGNETIGGVKTFTGSPQVPNPIFTGDAVNQGYLAAVSGVISSSILSGLSGASGVLAAGGGSGIQLSNTFFRGPTATGTTGVPFFGPIVTADLGTGMYPYFSGMGVGSILTLTGLAGAVSAINFVGTSITNGAGFSAFRYAASAGGVSIFTNKSRTATIGAHSATLTNDVIYDQNMCGSDGTGFIRGARFFVQAQSNYAVGSGQSFMAFAPSDASGVSSTVLTVDQVGVKSFKALTVVGDVRFGKVITPPGTTGPQTINTTIGSVNFAAAANSLLVTNNLALTSSAITCFLGSNDTTAVLGNAVMANGSFTINMKTAPTAETICYFHLFN